jgi:hypothetical protein
MQGGRAGETVEPVCPQLDVGSYPGEISDSSAKEQGGMGAESAGRDSPPQTGSSAITGIVREVFFGYSPKTGRSSTCLA